METDIVYTVREGSNSELRYSLRSLKNIPHRNVYMVGHIPHWVTNVIPLHTIQDGKKWENVLNNLLMACDEPGLSPNFILMNDDFFILRPLNYMPVLDRGPIKDIVSRYDKAKRDTRFIQGMRDTAELLNDFHIRNPISYELHIPMTVNKYKFKQALEISKNIEGFGKRTIYGNLNPQESTTIEDVKVTLRRRDFKKHTVFLSTDEDSFSILKIKSYLEEKFPDKCKYEKD